MTRRTALLLPGVALACAHPTPSAAPMAAPVACDPVVERSVATARRLPVVEIQAMPLSRTRYVDESGVERGVESGGAVVASLAEVEPMLRRLEWTGDLSAFGPRPDALYLVVWWRQSYYTPELVDAVYTRPGETLVSFVPWSRDLHVPVALGSAVTTSLHVLLVPPGEYGPIGFVTQEFAPLEGE